MTSHRLTMTMFGCVLGSQMAWADPMTEEVSALRHDVQQLTATVQQLTTTVHAQQ